MELMKNKRSMIIEVATFKNIRDKTKDVKALLNYLERNILPDINVEFVFLAEKTNGRELSGIMHGKNWDKVLKAIETKELACLNISEQMPADENGFVISHNVPALSFSIIFDYDHLLDVNGAANYISLSVCERLWGGMIPREIQSKLIEMLHVIIVSFEGVSGLVGYEQNEPTFLPINSYLEQLLNLDVSFHSKSYAETLRGYYWGNILSQGHIAKLGGLEYIKENAPCFLVEIINDNINPIVYLQLSEDLNYFDDDSLKRLKDFLKPILPQEDMGKIRRSLKIYKDILDCTRLVFNEGELKNG